MVYYSEHGFEDYVRLYKDQITNLWKSSYLSTSRAVETPVDETQDDLVAHIFKKRKIVQRDELDAYLKDSPADPYKTRDILTWWKVNISCLLAQHFIQH